MPRGEPATNPVEEAVLALWRLAAPDARCAGAEWWIGRSYTNDVPVGFHFDQDVRAARGLRHPLESSVFFFNRVRGGQLAVTDQRAGRRGEPTPAAAGDLHVVAPRSNRYAVFDGGLFHGVLDARGRTPGRKRPGPRGRLRVTLVVNFWDRRPAGVPRWRDARAFPVADEWRWQSAPFANAVSRNGKCSDIRIRFFWSRAHLDVAKGQTCA